MPTYDYTCQNCAFKFEELVFGEEVILCPSCESKQVQRELSGFAVGMGGSIPSEVVDAARFSAGGEPPRSGDTERDK